MNNNTAQHIEMSVELYRDPRDDGGDNLLIINRGKHSLSFEKLSGTDEPHSITWTLTGNASDGEFCALDEADNPGFLWLVRIPNEKIFQNLQSTGRNKLTIRNVHRDKSSEGLWHYQLFARFGDKVYGVPLNFGCGAAAEANPSIKNT
ncbi:hypothetical protein [Dyella psychrodurans]|uniref:Uncharacterized protein n=1 Tax=Dyella psychrodurans TaxID=1927960 RepID=A0A370WVT0_9GAMM|nr:hypothetical protein [Dyella psychrodurans]RDS80065.1 hypothetical protein DWU99_20080 [Dyella psychrodurans]